MKAMSWQTVEGGFRELVGMVLEEWGTLIGDEKTAVVGKREQLVGKLQLRHDLRKEQAYRRLAG
jgi:uncharacterized protein YjbJ (UPF0337 family)